MCAPVADMTADPPAPDVELTNRKPQTASRLAQGVIRREGVVSVKRHRVSIDAMIDDPNDHQCRQFVQYHRAYSRA